MGDQSTFVKFIVIPQMSSLFAIVSNYKNIPTAVIRFMRVGWPCSLPWWGHFWDKILRYHLNYSCTCCVCASSWSMNQFHTWVSSVPFWSPALLCLISSCLSAEPSSVTQSQCFQWSGSYLCQEYLKISKHAFICFVMRWGRSQSASACSQINSLNTTLAFPESWLSSLSRVDHILAFRFLFFFSVYAATVGLESLSFSGLVLL